MCIRDRYATGDWGGNSAGSEYETQVFMYFYNKIKPNVSIDIHTGGVTEYGDTCTIETGCKNNALDVITLVARTTTNNLILGNDIYPQSADACISSATYVEEMPNEVYFGVQYDWISQYDEDIFIAAKQISQEVLGTNYEDVGEQYSFYNYDGEIMTFDIDNHRLVKTPGFEIMITNIYDLSFEMKHDMIYMNVVRNEKEYQFLLTFAKEKQEIDDEIITEQ